MPVSMDERKNQLIGDLVLARAKVMDAVNAVPPLRADEVFLGVWSIKDLLAHLEGWDDTNLQAIREILAGQPPAFFQYFDKDWGSYNQRLVAQYKRLSLDELLADVKTSHQRLVSFLQALPARAIVHGKAMRETGRSVTIRNLLRAEARDETIHASQIMDHFSAAG